MRAGCCLSSEVLNKKLLASHGVQIMDLGSSDETSYNECRYCYANTNPALVKINMKKHDPGSPFLTGNSSPDEVIHKAEQKSWIDRQMRLCLF